MKTLLIDLWGTLLVNSEMSATDEIIQKLNINMKHHEFITFCDRQGLFSKTINSLTIWEGIASELGKTKEEAILANTIWMESSHSVSLFPHTKEFLLELKKRGYTLVLASAIGKNSYEILNKRFKFDNYFDHTIPTFTAGMGKCITYYEFICKKLSLNPKETCMIGDNLYYDIIPSIKAGLHAIFLNRFLLTSYEQDQVPQKAVECKSFENILEIIDEL